VPERPPSGLARSPRRAPAPARPGNPLSGAGSPWASAGVGAIFFGIYLLMAPPVSGDKDAGEFTLVLATNGVSHPTGYPLFTLFGHGFVRIAHALGMPWPLAANAWSALGGGVAMALFHALGVRLCIVTAAAGLPVLWAVVSAVLFGLDPMWTQETTLAEVYSWHVAWALGACLFFTAVIRRLSTPGAREPDRGLLLGAAAWGALCGVGAAHHLTSVFVAAPLSAGIVIGLARAGRWRWTLAAAALAASLVPLSSYGIVAWRAFHPVAIQWPVLTPTWQGVLRHVTGAQYRLLLGHFAPSGIQRTYLVFYVYPYVAIGLAALLALAWRARGAAGRRVVRTLLAAAVLSTAYALVYGAFDPSSYFLAGMAIGLCSVGPLGAQFIAERGIGRGGRAAIALLVALALAAQLVPWTRMSAERRQVYVRFEKLVHQMWTSIPFTRGFVVWSDDMYLRLREYQLLNGEKPELAVVNPFLLTHLHPRSRFAGEHGFDPLGGIADRITPLVAGWESFAPGRDTLIREAKDLILHNINRQTPLPVVEFLPESVSVRLLRKPAEPSPGR